MSAAARAVPSRRPADATSGAAKVTVVTFSGGAAGDAPLGTMRDPLHWMSVKHKLALAFAGLCLLAFGVGGYLISISARAALQEEIEARIELQCRGTARSLDDGLRLLARRTEDFASDGYLRERVAALLAATSDQEAGRLRAELTSHLAANKLPLVAAFEGLTLVDEQGRVLVHVQHEGAIVDPHALPAAGDADGPIHGDLSLPDHARSTEGDPLHSISTPLRALDGRHRLGRLVAWVASTRWMRGALQDASPLSPAASATALPLFVRVEDRAGRALIASPASASGRSPGPLRLQSEAAANAPVLGEGGFADSFPVRESGWTVHVRLRAIDAFAPISGLQSRFLGVGVVLALLCAALTFFPMRFLVRPLEQLRTAARRIREGDYAVRVPAESNDEVGDLARAFNHMAEAVDQKTRTLSGVAEELRERQRELREQHERLNTVIRSLRDGLVVLDPSGSPVLSNEAALPLVSSLARIPETFTTHGQCPAEAATPPSCAACLVRTDEPARSCVIDVGARSFEVHATPLPPDAAGQRGRVLVARDITDRLARDERDIHRERLSVLGEVAAVMAHELNNPLTSIRMFAQMLESGLPEKSPYREHAAVIVRNTETCRHTIRALLGYATNTATETGPVHVHDVIDDVVRFVRPLADRGGVAITTRCEAPSHVVQGDEIQLRQLLVNLVLNAVQAADGESVDVTISTHNEGRSLIVEVCDTGPGIPQEARDRIFDAFFSTKPRGEGTGLGLPTARRIAEIHGGGLELAHSRPGSTTFRVRLRAVAVESPVA